MLLLARYARSAAISIIYKLDMPRDTADASLDWNEE